MNQSTGGRSLPLHLAAKEMDRRKREVLRGAVAAMAAAAAGADHPQRLTPERRYQSYLAELQRREHFVIAKSPALPKIIVTRPILERWGDFKDTRRGRFGAVLQE